ncbi:MAG TPA: PQQ-binding-like beta-propeller repeat protein [Candidatus Saccharimonadales bacterium]|nr:PQQ-binding-like beta-propeller repeat protein [Candidatus Saccharimonadales bacterium]
MANHLFPNRTLNQIRSAALIFPPLGLVWLWASRQVSVLRKILGTCGIAAYSLLYIALFIFLMVRFAGMETEFRGGYIPYFTFHKTKPDFSALEANRVASREKALGRNPSSISSYWTGYRGPKRDGHYTERSIATNWPASGLKPLWRQPVGGGYASFAVSEGRAFTIEQRRDQEVATAYAIDSGAELWAVGWKAEFTEQLGGDGPRATPVADGTLVYFLGALGELRCLDTASGKMLWRRNIVEDTHAPLLVYGMAASPLIIGEKLIVTPGGPRTYSVLALNKKTGETIWHALDDEAAYSSPMEVELAGKRQLLVVCETRAVGLDPDGGKLLWEFPWVVAMGNRNISQPLLLSSNRFFLSAGYGTGCVAVEVNQSGPNYSARAVWRNKNLKNKFSSSVFHNGNIYGLDEDLLTCLNAETGSREWKEGRYGYGQLLLASDRLVILSGSGELALVAARSDRHLELARFSAIQGKTWNHPAINDGRILLRNSREMACFDLTGAQR